MMDLITAKKKYIDENKENKYVLKSFIKDNNRVLYFHLIQFGYFDLYVDCIINSLNKCLMSDLSCHFSEFRLLSCIKDQRKHSWLLYIHALYDDKLYNKPHIQKMISMLDLYLNEKYDIYGKLKKKDKNLLI